MKGGTKLSDDSYLVVADAAAQIGVSVQRVRALLASGDLTGQLVGNVWLIDPESLARHRHVRKPAAGRVLAPATAWAALMTTFASDVPDDLAAAFRVVDERRARLLALRRRDVDDWRWLARRRATVMRYSTRPAYLEQIAGDPEVQPAGLSAGLALALVANTPAFDAYVDSATGSRLADTYRLRPDAAGNLTLRIVNVADAQQLAVIRRGTLPTLVIAVDLIEDRDPRTARAGRELFAAELSRTSREAP